MPVRQIAYDIPDNIMIRILTGEYIIKNEKICYAEGPKKGRPVKFKDDSSKTAALFDQNVINYIKKQRDRIGQEFDRQLSKFIKGDPKKHMQALEKMIKAFEANKMKMNAARHQAADKLKEKKGQVAQAGAFVVKKAVDHKGKVKAAGNKMEQAASKQKDKIAQGVKTLGKKAVDNKNGLFLGLAAAAAIAFVVAVVVSATTEKAGVDYEKTLSHESTDKALKRFRKALKIYIEGVRGATMDRDRIAVLDTAIKCLEQNSEYEQMKIILAAENLGELVDLIQGYTRQFAEINGVALNNDACSRDGEALEDLKKYLYAQDRIFIEVAS